MHQRVKMKGGRCLVACRGAPARGGGRAGGQRCFQRPPWGAVVRGREVERARPRHAGPGSGQGSGLPAAGATAPSCGGGRGRRPSAATSSPGSHCPVGSGAEPGGFSNLFYYFILFFSWKMSAQEVKEVLGGEIPLVTRL